MMRHVVSRWMISMLSQKGPSFTPAYLTVSIITAIMGVLFFFILPIYVGTLAKTFSLSNEQVGLFASIDLLTASLMIILLSFYIDQINIRMLLLISIVMFTFVNLVCAFVGHIRVLLLLRAVSGLGTGVFYAVGIYYLGRWPKPDRAFALYGAVAQITQIILLLIMPYLIAINGLSSIFLVFAVSPLLLFYLVRFLPSKTAARDTHTQETSRMSVLMCVLGLTANFFFFIVIGAIWAYLERIGNASGLSLHQISVALSASIAVGVSGSIVAYRIGSRINRFWLIWVSSIIMIASFVILSGKMTYLQYFIACCLFDIGFAFGMVFLMGNVAKSDHTGKFTTALPALQFLALMLGPVIASGAIALVGGLAGVPYLAIITIICSSLISSPNSIYNARHRLT